MSDLLPVRTIVPAVTIDGMPLAGVERLEVRHGGGFEAGRFRIEVAMGAMPGGAAWFAAMPGGEVSIGVGDGGAGIGAAPLIVGQIDNVAIEFAHGVAVLSGRDLAARLIDAEVDETLSNLTASQIATGFAAAAGLGANVTATTTRVGQYYELAHARTGLGLHSRHATRWDLLAALATIEQFTLSVSGTTLNFTAPTAAAVPIVLTLGRDLLTLACDRALGLVAPKVTVRSWNPKLKRAFSRSAGGGPGQAGGTTLIRPNLTQSEVERLAAAHQAALAAQAVLLRGSMPGETAMMPGSALLLQGTGSALDGPYVVRGIERVVDARAGFRQRFEAIQAGAMQAG